MTTQDPITPTRNQRVFDVVLAVVIFVLSLFVTEGADPDDLALRGLGELPLIAYPLFASACAAVVWRRTHPVPVYGVTYVLGLISGIFGWSDLVGFSFIVSLYSVARYSDSERITQVALALAVLFAAGTLLLLDENSSISEAVFGVGLMAGIWYVGRRVRLRAERRLQIHRERLAEARRMVTEERARIARELHDVVAHRVSLMTVQAGAAKTIAGTDLERAVEAMQAVEHAGREALDELRQILDVLRPESTGDDLGPQPGLGDLPRLVAEFEEAGVEVSLVTSDLPPALPSRVDLFAYRIVQEALTNVLKHAGEGAGVEVRVVAGNGRLHVEVLDRGGGGGTTLPGAGHGLVGMRERAALLGGSIEVGPREGGGFQVVARLPIEEAS